MYPKSDEFIIAEKRKSHVPAENSYGTSLQREIRDFNPDTRRKEELAQNLHMKNRKKYMHLYQLEKYFK
jgi:hypothetical protein